MKWLPAPIDPRSDTRYVVRMEGVLAILMVFGMPVAIVFIVKYFKALEKGLVGPRSKPQGLLAAERQQLEAIQRERQQLLEARVQNLETIVCSVDLELLIRSSSSTTTRPTPTSSARTTPVALAVSPGPHSSGGCGGQTFSSVRDAAARCG